MLSKALSALSRKKMSTVDTAWLRMDSDSNLMMIVGVAMLDKPISAAALKLALTTRFLVFSRFRSRVVSDLSGSWWQEQRVDLDDHVVPTRLAPALPAGASNKPALQQLVGALSQQPLAGDKPLWQMHLVDHCVGEDGRVRQALIVRIHHCIADGVALVGVFMSMFGSKIDIAPAGPSTRAAAAAEENPWAQILLPVTVTSVKAIDQSSNLLVKSMSMLGELDKLGGQLAGLGHTAGQLALDAVKLTTIRRPA
jgi:diacylglycerol O-acyltransferase